MVVVFVVLYANSRSRMPCGVETVFYEAPVLTITKIMAMVPRKKRGRRSFFIIDQFGYDHKREIS